MSRIHAALLKLLLEVPDAALPALTCGSTDERAARWVLAKAEKCHLNLARHWVTQGVPFAEQSDLEVGPERHARAIEIIKLLPPTAILIKGPALHRYYPRGVDRFSSDIDVLIADPSSLREVHACLPASYLPDGEGFWHVPMTGGLDRFFASQRYATREGTRAACSLEVQIGGFPISWERVLPFDVVARDACALPGYECRCLSPTGQLLLAITDFGSRRGAITVRHLADLIHFLRVESESIDLQALAACLTDHGLWHGLGKFFAAMDERGLRAEVPPLLDALARLRPDRWEHLGLRAGRRRASVASLVDACFRAAEGRAVGRWLLPLADRSFMVRYLLRAGYRVCAVPVITRPNPFTELVECGGVFFLIHGAGVYALSLMRVEDARRRALFELFRSAPSRQSITRFDVSPS